MRSREEIGAMVASLRRAAGLTQHEVATAAGFTRPALANIEAGRQGLPVDTLERIASALGTTAAALLDEDRRPTVSTTLLADVVGGQRRITKLLAELADVVHALAEASERHEKTLAELLSITEEDHRD